ncbi:MAG: xylosidase/arabinosidase [Planctomycetia bacterium]|nr:xylosidase/arabinosidase [Planctomycetia bacterium]
MLSVAAGLVAGNGQSIQVFSSHLRPTVSRHFRWMQDYGIDGVFVQRFATNLRHAKLLAHATKVLGHCRDGALEHGRVYAVMYDLTGMKRGQLGDVVDDWRLLRSRMGIGDDPASLQTHGRPLVAIWSIGFNDDRDYTLAECRELIAALQADGCSVMCGVPTGWRTLDRDAVVDSTLHELVAMCDVVSPWTVGRYGNPADVVRHAERDWKPDIAWCAERGIDYLPVAFPGFSWHNLRGGPLGQIPRQKGRLFWSQVVEARRAGAKGLYVAMFDEVDEATAIFKCVDPPAGPLAKQFVGLEGMPGDFYLRLAGEAGKVLRGERPPSAQPPGAMTPPQE